MRAIYIIIILIAHTISCGQAKCQKKQEFHILFGSGFRNDTVSLDINYIPIFRNIVMTSTFSTGYATSLAFKNDIFTIYHDDGTDRIVLSTFEYNKTLDIIVTINKRPYGLSAYLKDGKYIKIDKHHYYYNVYLNQYRKPVVLE